MSVDLEALYRQTILEHGKSPRNEGPLDGATHEATVHNPLCGDRVTLRLLVVEGGIVEARFELRGCLLARASSSLVSEALRGRTVDDALALVRDVEALVQAGTPSALIDGDLSALGGAQAFPARRGCVTLVGSALARALVATQ